MAAVTGVADFFERKGSLFLRSDHMNYGRATLNSNWHQAREAEPKDYDLSKDDERDLGKATYIRIGNTTDGLIPKTTYQEFADQTKLKEKFTERQVRKPMVNLDTLAHVDMDRDVGTPKQGYGSVLPRYNPDYNKYYLDSTHRSDFKPPNPDYVFVPECLPDFDDKSAAYRKCHSQFTDTADFRRPGRNTWQDESGVYTNTHFKSEVFKPTDTIPSRLT